MSISKLKLEPNDIVIVTSNSRSWTPETMGKLSDNVRNRYPDWNGTFVVLEAGETLETLKAGDAIRILEALKAKYEKSEEEEKVGLWTPN